MNNLMLVKSENFGSVQCDFWRNENDEILMTREQIGSALEYSEPRKAIQKIHERNQDRFDRFSVVTKLTTTDGKQYDTYVYTAKGVYEICRFSRQPKADAFMDWVWNVIESLRTGQNALVNSYLAMSEEERAIAYFQQAKTNKELQNQNLLMLPKVEVYNTFLDSGNLQTIEEAAKTLGTGRNRLYAFLREQKMLKEDNLPYQRYLDDGYFSVVQKPLRTVSNACTMVTARGIVFLAKRVREAGLVQLRPRDRLISLLYKTMELNLTKADCHEMIRKVRLNRELNDTQKAFLISWFQDLVMIN